MHSLSKLNGGLPHIAAMPNRRRIHQGMSPNRLQPLETPAQRRWRAVTDWLGAQKPLNLILGAVTLIAVFAALAQLHK
ncbi:hypothetical protein IAG41_12275 [Sphingomonas sp. JC676]|uniref:hypothetical protein n=1 Tax=Sphingomonas sp. JC676 TaxID=2768065 RepID=UPI001657C722|nr:hypothetical protein [Sphingomonas sp. JC676]MBC9033167.1 hypothetical protein [Sphingomonas sp. JC676]